MEKIFPTIGVITSTLIYLSPYDSVKELKSNPQLLQDHNVLPYPMIANNALVWLLYSLLVKDPFIFWSNIFGFIAGIYYSLNVHTVASLGNYGVKAKRLLQVWISGLAICWSGAYYAFLAVYTDIDAAVNGMGITAIILLIMFYTSPLASFMQVIKTKDASLFSYSLSVTCGINSIVWVTYGWMKDDIYIWGPNLVGLVVAMIQILCKVIYGNRSAQFQRV